MDTSAKGRVVVEVSRELTVGHLEAVASAIDTPTALDTARLVPWFGPTVAGDGRLVESLGLDLSRALLAGQAYRWSRPFRQGETVSIKVVVDDVYEKGANTFGVVKTEMRDGSGALVQEQRTTFIERGSK